VSTIDNETPSATPPEKSARWEDFIDLFISPRELFARRANDSWTVPLIVIAVFSLLLAIVLRPAQAAMQEAAMAARGMTAEQQAAAQRMGPVMGIIGAIFAPIGMIIAVFIGSLITLIAAKIASIDVGLRRALMITSYVTVLVLLQQAIGGVFMMMKLNRGEEIDMMKDNSFGVLRFMDSEGMNNVVQALLSRVDLFAIWGMVLYAIAFMAAAKAPKSSAWIAAGIIWAIGAIFMLIPAAMS
jgi:hypothetical protein